MKFVLLLLVAVLFVSFSDSFKLPKRATKIDFRNFHLTRHQLPPPEAPKDAKAPMLTWITQKLDHFQPSDARTWEQKYFYNLEWYNIGGPIFIMIGGESAAYPEWVQSGQMVEQAKLYRAAVFYLEHRFYGDSHPTEDISTDNMQYLSAEQALADLAHLIQYLRDTEFPDGKLVVFGGSYAGNLAAWAKLRYPDLIDGAIASSAPVQAQVDFPEYQEVVATAMGDSDPNCLADVKAASDAVTAILEGANGAETITDMFNLCNPYDPSNKQDVAVFYSAFANVFAGVVQYAESLSDVAILCDEMTNTVYGETPLDRYVRFASFYLAEQGGCFDHSYSSYDYYFGDTDWFSLGSLLGTRQWFYQTCTEFGYYQTSTSSIQPFGDFYKVDFFLQWCPDFYSPNFDETFVNNAISNTNLLYGGINPQVENVVFVHGSIDPWHVLGVLEDLSDSVHVVMIEGSAHCADIYPPSLFDSDALTAARLEISEWIGKWVQA